MFARALGAQACARPVILTGSEGSITLLTCGYAE
jgi:hypothetical protein